MIKLLSDIRVLDASRLIPGAYATSKLADMGADVIKIEQPPMGDYLRAIEPLMDDLGLYYMALNRNKRSILLDPRTDEGHEQFQKLVKTADVFIEGSRPGAMAKIGADYETLRAIKPDIIYCSLSAFGQSGPYSGLPAHGANLEGASGVLAPEIHEDGSATIPSVNMFMASQSGGTHAALAIVAALHQRDVTGEGSYLDVACWEGAVSWQYGNLAVIANLGVARRGTADAGPRYRCYQTSDGGWTFIGLVEPKFWKSFCDAVARPDLKERFDYTRATDFGLTDATLSQDLADLFLTRSTSDWTALAVEHQLPMAPIIRPEDLLTNEHAIARQMFAMYPHPKTGTPVKVLRIPLTVEGQSFEITRPAPQLGEHTKEILAELEK